MGRDLLHYGIHLLLPVLIGVLAYPGRRLKAVLILLSGLLIDLDHLLADPVFDPDRCSIGFHPLHGLYPIALYLLLCYFPRTRLVGIGLVLHMALDALDCQITSGVWFV